MSSDSVVVFDVSRLLSRAKRGTPTGIDRVELDEVERLLHQAHRLAFFATRGKRSWFVDQEPVLEIARTLQRRWGAGSEKGWGSAARVLAELGAPASELDALKGEDTVESDDGPRIPGPRSLHSQRLSRRWERILQDEKTSVTYRNVSHHHLDKQGFLESLKNRWNARIEVFWHDAIPITWPEYSREGDADKHRRRLQSILAWADVIEVNSQTTKDELQRLAADQRHPPINVRPLSPALLKSEELTAFSIDRPYFISVGTIEPRKNHLLLLQVWRELSLMLGDQCPALVIAGQRGWLNEHTFAMLDRSPALKGTVIEAPNLPDSVLAPLMAQAEALLMPSFAEGFGLPIVEAAALGTPVIASDLAVFREVATAEFTAISPLSGDAWKQAVLGQLAKSVGTKLGMRQSPSHTSKDVTN